MGWHYAATGFFTALHWYERVDNSNSPYAHAGNGAVPFQRAGGVGGVVSCPTGDGLIRVLEELGDGRARLVDPVDAYSGEGCINRTGEIVYGWTEAD